MSSPSAPPTTTTNNLFSTIRTLRSYGCYNCNRSFLITRVSPDASPPPTSFRCPFCFQLHLIPLHTVVPPPPPTLRDDEYGAGYDYVPAYVNNNYISIANFLNSLPVKELDSNTKKSACSICMDKFGRKIVVELPCRHYFDKECIWEWLKRAKTCPMCRATLHLGGGFSHGVGSRREVIEYNRMIRILREPPAVLRRIIPGESSLSAVANADARGTDRRVLSTDSGGERDNAEARGVDQRLLSTNAGGESAGATNDEDTMMDYAA